MAVTHIYSDTLTRIGTPLCRTSLAAAIVEADPKLRDGPLHEQVAYFASILPAGMIGRHAVQHIEWALKYVAKAPY